MESVVRNYSPFVSIVTRIAALSSLMAMSLAFLARPAEAARIEAVRGKNYSLGSKHGPWMIMVTSLWGETPEKELQAAKAATELVYQLRKSGVPAYIYKQDDQIEELNLRDRSGRPQRRKITARNGEIAVLAGNYENADDKTAQQTLKFIKKFKPTVTVDWRGAKQDVPLVLTNAFISRNPMLSPEDLARKHADPLLVKLNSNVEHSLLENPGRFTLTVASFNGQSIIKPASYGSFDRNLTKKSNISLDNAARESWELMTVLRQQGFEAYVYHERYRSIVTIGSFKSDKDPRIAQLFEKFRAKEKTNPDTKQVSLHGEITQIPGKRKNDPPLKFWLMDPAPKLIEVPKQDS